MNKDEEVTKPQGGEVTKSDELIKIPEFPSIDEDIHVLLREGSEPTYYGRIEEK